MTYYLLAKSSIRFVESNLALHSEPEKVCCPTTEPGRLHPCLLLPTDPSTTIVMLTKSVLHSDILPVTILVIVICVIVKHTNISL
ncbi:hypothetical protein FGIG_00251 [Fasciola gigantica]|uniref:Uncharacterized protein n=1 Tax=Fasciola gigantica TaxID=46835 RepID=A0A504Z1C2_FASGI|nr:hypothetical protein FGIG_00251 [Fasciola gigantica]